MVEQGATTKEEGMTSVEQVREWLMAVMDPEIPVLSLVDLGVVADIQVEGKRVAVELTPTFSGCPAMDYMKADVEEVLRGHGLEPVVSINFRRPWSTDLISEKGLAAIKVFGLALPGKANNSIIEDIDLVDAIACPNCGSMETELASLFGPTLCRSIHICHSCKETFEQFKPL